MRKFAIYKAETGYYYRPYYDTMESLKGTELDGLVLEDKLPVIADGGGGYFSFNGNDYCFDRLVETEDECPLTLEQMFFKNWPGFKLGWVSPDGDTYACDYTSHTRAAIMLTKRFFPHARLPERTLGKAGWLKIIDSWDGTQREHKQFVYSLTGKITKRQADILFDLGLYHNEEVQQMIKDCEQLW